MEDAILLSRLQFAFTIVYHYLFPQLTMGLALFLVVLKTLCLRRGHNRPNFGDGGRLRLLPRVGLPRDLPLRRAPLRPEDALVLGVHAPPWDLGFGLLHFGVQRLDAEPGRLRGGRGRWGADLRLLGGPPQPLGLRPVCAQPGRDGRDSCLRDDGTGGVLSAGPPRRALRADVRPRRPRGGRDRERLDAL